jgi:aflatoxin B1 aldehyde reductase
MQTPLEEQAAIFNKLFIEGKFSKFGLCNFPPEMLAEWLSIAEKNNYVKPTVFQGAYNLLCRTYESTLFPLLRQHGISFKAYSPLAGGFLTGKVTFSASSSSEELTGSRWHVENPLGQMFRFWYDKPGNNEFIRRMKALCDPHGISLVDASHRWLIYHSPLDGENGDGIILGTSSVDQLRSCIAGIKQGPLPNELAQALDELWPLAKENADGIFESLRKITEVGLVPA